jgi:hypothetical protein
VHSVSLYGYGIQHKYQLYNSRHNDLRLYVVIYFNVYSLLFKLYFSRSTLNKFEGGVINLFLHVNALIVQKTIQRSDSTHSILFSIPNPTEFLKIF